MSRVGKQPIIVPQGVTLDIEGQRIVVNGPKGELTLKIPQGVEVKVAQDQVVCQAKKDKNNLWGLVRTLIANALTGVSSGWTKTLELVGVGFRATVEGPASPTGGDELVLMVGFSHPVRIKAPAGVSFSVSENKVKITGVDKQVVGEVAAGLRKIRPPEPYKGKGIKYEHEFIRRKVGKVAKALGAGVGGGK